MTTETTPTPREPITVAVNGRTWVFAPAGHPSPYHCDNLRLRRHGMTGWSVDPLYGSTLREMGVTGNYFIEPTPEAAMRAFLAEAAQFIKRREAQDEALRKHGLLPPAPDTDARKAMVEEIMEAAETVMIKSAQVALNQTFAMDTCKAKAKLRALVEKALEVTK